MANRKAFIVPAEEESVASKKFTFSDSFNKSFDALTTAFADALMELNKVSTGKSLKSEYGVCSCNYRLRYVTPNDVSTYVSNLTKGLETGLFRDRISDAELFTVASVKRFIEDNGCPAFESAAVDGSHAYINPKECTLHDLACICENDTSEVAVYSRGEMLKRINLMKEDVKKINDMHFAANIKKIVKALPEVLKKGTSILENKAYKITFGTYIEEFILFVCTLNTIAVLQMLAYAKPVVDYTIKPKAENSEDLITECCLVNTTTYMVRSKLPFNCNMRDVILQDVTPDFKDTHDALHFIMKDPRSPISVLVAKYADSDVSPYDSSFIAKLFVGMNHDFDHSDYYHRNGDRSDATPRDVDNFTTNVDWLDTIAFGNNYLDGNYRRDAMGNNHVNPIVNNLDMLYRVFGGCDLKTNKDLANNIIRVAGAIKSIVTNYRDGDPVENYDITKDILVLLGEIFTRNMLRLYYNNTRVLTYEDKMTDAMAPGFVCMESFVMEADANANADANKPKVTVTNKEGQPINSNQNAANKTGIASDTIKRLIEWIKNQLSKLPGFFEKQYSAAAKAVKDHEADNAAIAKAIGDGSFNVNLTEIPVFDIKIERFKGMDKAGVTQLLDPNKPYDANAEQFRMLGIDNNTATAIQQAANQNQTQAQTTTDKNKKKNSPLTDAIVNYFLTGKATPPQPFSGKLGADAWNTMCNDLIKCQDFVKQASDSLTKTVKDAADAVNEKSTQAANNNNEAQKKRCDEVTATIRTISDEYIRAIMFDGIGGKFFKTKYELYCEILKNFKQQSNNNNQPVNQNPATQQTQGQQANQQQPTGSP